MEAQDHYAEGQNCLDRAEEQHSEADTAAVDGSASGRSTQQYLLFDANVYVQRAQAHFLAAQVQLMAFPAVRSGNYPDGDFT